MISRLSSLCPGAVGAVVAALALSCATSSPDEDPSGFGMRVQWLTGEPSATLPEELAAIDITVFPDPDSDTFEQTRISRSLFSDGERGPFLTTPLLDGLPVGTPIRILVEGLDEAGQLQWIGHVGPLVLGAGERRFVDLKMYPLARSVVLGTEELPGLFMHTATALPDGRVLVAGGFDRIESGVECPEGVLAETRCFALSASRDAFVFDPTSGTFHQLKQDMLEARAGHTATLLPGGRVLLAGGAEAGLLTLTPLGDPDAPRGYAPGLVPLRDGEVAAHGTFEIFLPEANREADDVDRDGDPGRGGFVGSAAAGSVAGRLNAQRFLHAAAAVPGHPERVLLVGGGGSPEESGDGSWEVYDDRKPGGYGVYDGSANSLTSSRLAPSAVALAVPEPEGRIWIFGGNLALDDDDLAEIWQPSEDDPNGTVQLATETPFPGEMSADDTPHPEYALAMPSVAAVADGTTALVVGWLGPQCLPGETTPVFPEMPDGSDVTLCGEEGPSRSFVVDGLTGVTRRQEVARPHAFGAMAELDDGSVVLSGGIASLVWNRQPVIEIFTGNVSAGTAVRGPTFMFQTARAFHAAAGLPQAGMLAVGGLSLSTDVRNASLVSNAEVLYPRRPAFTGSTGGAGSDM